MLKLSRQFLKSLVNELNTVETDSLALRPSKNPFIRRIGTVDFKHYKLNGSLPLYIGSPESPDVHMSYASLCKMEDDGNIIIIIRDDTLLFTNGELFPMLIGAIAHELGHYINGDLDKKTSKQKFLLGIVDKDIEKQIIASKLDDHSSYITTVVFALLGGGVVRNELNADITGIQLTGLSEILASQMYDDIDTINLAVLLEKRNRINRLVKLVKETKLSRDIGSSIEIIIFGDSHE